MKRLVLGITIGVALLVIIAGAMAFMIIRREPRWSTGSPEALRAFNAGLEAEQKIYHEESREHFERAVRLDPNFLYAKVKLAEKEVRGSKKGRETYKRLLESIDASKLNDRERFLVRYALAQANRESKAARDIVESYVREHPHDPFGWNSLCALEWDERNWAKAESSAKRLIELDPNWVSAQNNLGYIAMAQGRFREAEELFRTYRYIAPDQANPHDSLGELLTLIGRYDEAKKEFEEALAVRSDFCATYNHLSIIAILQKDFDEAEELLARSQKANCQERYQAALRCSTSAFREYTQGNWDRTVEAAKADECYKNEGAVLVIGFAAALATGRTEDAALLENSYREGRRKAFAAYDARAEDPILLHFEGVRLAFDGSEKKAAEKLREADRQLVYWGDGQGIFKLYNRIVLAKILESAGEVAEARTLLAQLQAVNPHVLTQMQAPSFGRERRRSAIEARR